MPANELPRRPHQHRQGCRTCRPRGSALLEALVAFLVLSLGMLAVARLQSHLRLGADISRQRSEAVRLAQEDIETLRSFAVLSPSPSPSPSPSAAQATYNDIATATRHVNAAHGYASQTDYTVSRTIEAAASLRAKSATVAVAWTDLGGDPQQVVLQSIIAGIDPAFSSALTLARGADPVTGPFGRSIRIPLSAKDLGDGRSALKPLANGSVAFVLDNTSGRVTGRCNVTPTIVTADLAPASLGACDATPGLLLSGTVRFSSASAPDPGLANEVPLPLSIHLTTTGAASAAPPVCALEAVKVVTYIDTSTDTHPDPGLHLAAVPIAATPASLGLANWTDTGDRHLQYRCVVYPGSGGSWTGHVGLAPLGWTLGAGASDRKVCRYSSDLDGSGAIDGNIEHPGDYAAVDTALAHQNFLVIRGNSSCPSGHAVEIEGHASDIAVDLSTTPHSP